MNINPLRGNYFTDRNAYIAAQEPGILHCHHYNTYLQAVLEDASTYLDTVNIMKDAAQELAYQQLSTYFKSELAESIEQRKQIVEDFYVFSGFGKLSLHDFTDHAGSATVSSEHYGVGLKLKFGIRDSSLACVAYFASGFIAGACEAIYDLPLSTLHTTQTHCISKGDSVSEFVIQKSDIPRNMTSSPQEGLFQTGVMQSNPASAINYEAIRSALINMPVQGDASSGLIDAFGVLLTRMYANYYTLISYRFLKAFENQMGFDGLQIAQELLVESGHNCAYNTFGGIMQSMEWNGLIKPMIKTKEDWVYGIVAVINALGWGIWEIIELVADKKLVLKITSGYEANSYLKMYQTSKIPISFLATGAAAGLMNLVYNTTITETPVSLDAQLYKTTCSLNTCFVSKQTKCRAMGDTYDLFEATKF